MQAFCGFSRVSSVMSPKGAFWVSLIFPSDSICSKCMILQVESKRLSEQYLSRSLSFFVFVSSVVMSSFQGSRSDTGKERDWLNFWRVFSLCCSGGLNGDAIGTMKPLRNW